jgi:hypothetical protein
MSRNVVGLLAAVATTTSVLAGMVHGHLEPFVIVSSGLASGLVRASPCHLQKNSIFCSYRKPHVVATADSLS